MKVMPCENELCLLCVATGPRCPAWMEQLSRSLLLYELSDCNMFVDSYVDSTRGGIETQFDDKTLVICR